MNMGGRKEKGKRNTASFKELCAATAKHDSQLQQKSHKYKKTKNIPWGRRLVDVEFFPMLYFYLRCDSSAVDFSQWSMDRN
jgi:hypothetical protein